MEKVTSPGRGLAPRQTVHGAVTRELLEAAKTAHAIPSNYRLARVLGVTDNTLGNWQSGRSIPNTALAMRLAEMAGRDPAIVVAELAAERAQDDDERDLWRGIAARLRQAGMACLVGAVMVLGAPPEARAFEAHSALDVDGSVRYVNLQSRQGRLIMVSRPALMSKNRDQCPALFGPRGRSPPNRSTKPHWESAACDITDTHRSETALSVKRVRNRCLPGHGGFDHGPKLLKTPGSHRTWNATLDAYLCLDKPRGERSAGFVRLDGTVRHPIASGILPKASGRPHLTPAAPLASIRAWYDRRVGPSSSFKFFLLFCSSVLATPRLILHR